MRTMQRLGRFHPRTANVFTFFFIFAESKRAARLLQVEKLRALLFVIAQTGPLDAGAETSIPLRRVSQGSPLEISLVLISLV